MPKSVTRWLSLAVALALGSGLSLPVQARPLDTRTLGMGGTHLATVEGGNESWSSPALLGLDKGRNVALALPNLSLGVGLGLSAPGWDNFLNGKSYSTDQIKVLLDQIPEGGLGLLVDTGLAIAFSAPAVQRGFFVRTSVDSLGVNLPKDLFRLVLQGNDQAGQLSLSSLKGARVEASQDIGGAYAIPFTWGERPYSLAFAGRGMYAWCYRITDVSGALLTTDADGALSMNTSLTYQAAQHGFGAAADLSLATDFNDQLRLVGALNNLGAIRWQSVDEKVVTLTMPRTLLDLSKLKDLQPPATATTDGPNRGALVWETLPPVVAVGMRYQLNSRLSVANEYELGFGRGFGASDRLATRAGAELRLGPLEPINWLLWGVSRLPLLGFVGQWRSPWQLRFDLPLRAGFAAGGERPVQFSVGGGLDLYTMKLELAATTLGGLFADAQGVYYAAAFEMQF